MNFILWLVLVMGYGLVTWAAGRRKFAEAALYFLCGGYLSFLCFSLFPYVMGTEQFFLSAILAGAGILAGFGAERYQLLPLLIFSVVTGCQFFWQEPLCLREILFLSFFGGIGLYHASAGIIPDEIEIRNAIFSSAGFLSGTFLFVGF